MIDPGWLDRPTPDAKRRLARIVERLVECLDASDAPAFDVDEEELAPPTWARRGPGDDADSEEGGDAEDDACA